MPARADRVEQHVAVVVVDAHLDVRRRRSSAVHERADAADVVDVAVGVEQRDEPQLVVREPLEDRGRIGRRVDRARTRRRGRPARRSSVGLRQPEREAFDQHGG